MNGLIVPLYKGICDVQKNFSVYFKLLVNKVLKLFKVEGLPDTINPIALMVDLILRGNVVFTEVDGKLYALHGSVGGQLDVNYFPSEYIVANPVLDSKKVKIRHLDGNQSVEGLDGILVTLTDSDSYWSQKDSGLYGLIYQTAGLLADNISSLNMAQINSRLAVIFTADAESEARTAELTLEEIYGGKPYKVLTQNIIEKISANPVATPSSTTTLMSLIEAHQYILAQFYNEIGINANFNMKRERLNTAEVELNSDSLDLNIRNMEERLKTDIARVNERFGTNISIEIDQDVRDKIGNEEEEEIEDQDEELNEDKEVTTDEQNEKE